MAQGTKHDTGKLRWSLLPFQALHGVIKVLMHGEKKYGSHQWRGGMPWTRPYDALQRHLDAFMGGEDLDPESGESHLDHALCELIFMKMFTIDFPELDDRYKKATE